ncbi:MAG: hypothetical protein ABW221_11860 [Vicinamibacteria bacterium]
MAMGESGQRIGLVLAGAATALALHEVPSWQNPFTDVRVLALVVAGATIVLLGVTRLLGGTGIAVERGWMALFLAAMPVVYVVSFLTARQGPSAGWLAVELAGLALYAGLAVAGWRSSPWLLAAGVAAHGLAWDAWHLVGPSYVPPWYARGCLLVDVGVALYLATRVGTWRAARAVTSRS